jgi:mono/diheme cytochrome c family protein/thiol-disulfide isomerase/thioredoxin
MAMVAALATLVLSISAGASWFLRWQLGYAPPLSSSNGPVKVEGQEELVKRGRLVYQVHCANCHGAEGHGDGPSAAELQPRPRDFAATEWKFTASPTLLRRVIAEGIPGTAMPGSANALSTGELDAVVAFIQTLSLARQRPAPMPEATAVLLRRGGFVPADALQLAPSLEVQNIAGQTQSLTGLRGRLVLVVFWATDCIHCLQELPDLEKLAHEFREKGLVVLPVCANESDAAAAQAVARRRTQDFAIYVDRTGLANQRFDVQVLPTAFLIDPAGRLLGRAQGALDWLSPAVKELMSASQAFRD